MNFKLQAQRGLRTLGVAAGALAAALVLASCGGGKQVEKFVPTRVLSFGDESSVLDDSQSPGNARKYTVNYFNANTQLRECTTSPIWVQYVVQTFGMVFPQCNPANIANSPNRVLAAPGAGVVEVTAQIDQFLATDRFTNKDLVTIMVGVNDVLSRYKAYPTVSEAQATAEIEALGVQLANQVNRVAALGAKVVISTIVDIGQAPYAYTEKAAHTDIDRSAYMSRLVARFNSKLRVTILNDGRQIGLILSDELIQSIVRFPVGSTVFTDVATPVCDAAKAPDVRDCTTQTLIANGSGETFLWAQGIYLSAGGQRLIGELAATRALNNPF